MNTWSGIVKKPTQTPGEQLILGGSREHDKPHPPVTSGSSVLSQQEPDWHLSGAPELLLRAEDEWQNGHHISVCSVEFEETALISKSCHLNITQKWKRQSGEIVPEHTVCGLCVCVGGGHRAFFHC